MRLHLPSLQAAAALAAATPKDKAPLRLIQVVRRPGGGQSYLATCEGRVAIRCDHPCLTPAPKATYLYGQKPSIDSLMPIDDTALPEDKTLLIWADSVPSKKPTKADCDSGCWIDPEEAGLVLWRVVSGAHEVRLGSDGPKLPKEPGLTHLLGVPDLAQLLREFIPGNYFAGHSGRFNAAYLGLLSKAAELMARGFSWDGTYGRSYGDTPSLELYTDLLREGSQALVDLTAQRADDATAPQAWGLLMPIQRREGGRGKQLQEVAA